MSPVRVLSGPNRGGKTTAGVFDDVCALLGHNPYRPNRKYTLPTLVWGVSLDNKRLGRVLWQRLKSMLPPGGYREFRQDQIIVMHKRWGSSEFHLMSCEAGPGRFKGAEADHVHLDEEPNPRGDEIFNEIYSRFGPERDLDIIMTFTPDEGASWSYGRLYDPSHEDYLRGANGEKVVDFFEFSLYDCDVARGGHMPYDKILRQFNAYKPSERKARFFGQYSLVGGRTYYEGELLDQAKARNDAQPRAKHARITIDGLKQTHLEYGEFGEGLIFEERIPHERYIVGIDVSGGTRQDYSIAYVIACGLRKRLENGDIVKGDLKPRKAFRFKSNRIDPERFAREVVYPLERYYNRAHVIPERNGEFGGALITSLRECDEDVDLWSDLKWDTQKQKWTGGVGWHTNDSTRGMVWSAHERALREGIDIYTPTCIAELGTIITKRNKLTQKERTEASYGCHDDEVFASGLALNAFHLDPPFIAPPIEECVEMYTGNDWQMEMVN
jgi:hypothetical protein